MVRRNSNVCPFFCSGYVSAAASPTSSTRDASTSVACPLAGDAFTSPSTATLAPVCRCLTSLS